jgi:uncharacterized protein YbaP (TraB family)
MIFKSLRFSRALWLAPMAALAAAPAMATASKATGGKFVVDGKAPVSALAAQPDPRPALWLLSDEDTKIYMFGTIHVLPPGFRWRSAAVDKAVGEASELVVETYDPPGKEVDPTEVPGFFTDKAVPILDRVPKKNRKTLKEAIQAAGLPLGIAQMLGEYGVDNPSEAPGVEDVLEANFRDSGKPILSVEDGDAVFASMSALPEPVQTQLLLEAIEPAPPMAETGPPEEIEWVAGHDDKMNLEGEAGFPPALFDVLVRKRNAAWTLWLAERLKKPGTVLFAVGAGHLAGKESVQAMLAQRGLRVKRVD